MALTPSDVGARAEAEVANALVDAGHRVFLPAFGAHGRVDLVFDDGSRLRRVQCKSARRVGDVLMFRTCSNTANQPREYTGEVDDFGVFAPDLGAVFLVPAAGLPSRACSLRLGPARNGQERGVRWAEDYAIRRSG